eukprot:RCo034327
MFTPNSWAPAVPWARPPQGPPMGATPPTPWFASSAGRPIPPSSAVLPLRSSAPVSYSPIWVPQNPDEGNRSSFPGGSGEVSLFAHLTAEDAPPSPPQVDLLEALQDAGLEPPTEMTGALQSRLFSPLLCSPSDANRTAAALAGPSAAIAGQGAEPFSSESERDIPAPPQPPGECSVPGIVTEVSLSVNDVKPAEVEPSGPPAALPPEPSFGYNFECPSEEPAAAQAVDRFKFTLCRKSKLRVSAFQGVAPSSRDSALEPSGFADNQSSSPVVAMVPNTSDVNFAPSNPSFLPRLFDGGVDVATQEIATDEPAPEDQPAQQPQRNEGESVSIAEESPRVETSREEEGVSGGSPRRERSESPVAIIATSTIPVRRSKVFEDEGAVGHRGKSSLPAKVSSSTSNLRYLHDPLANSLPGPSLHRSSLSHNESGSRSPPRRRRSPPESGPKPSAGDGMSRDRKHAHSSPDKAKDHSSPKPARGDKSTRHQRREKSPSSSAKRRKRSVSQDAVSPSPRKGSRKRSPERRGGHSQVFPSASSSRGKDRTPAFAQLEEVVPVAAPPPPP